MPKKTARRPQPVILDAAGREGMRTVGRFAASLLDAVAGIVRPGVSTGEIDRLVDRLTRERGAVSAPLGYTAGGRHPFPKHCCTSVNHVVCHGIPSDHQVLADGDIVNVDVTPVIDGWHGDTSRTFCVGAVDPEVRRLVDDTFECMRRGISVVRPGGRVGDIGAVIQEYARSQGHSVVTQYAGHGVGRVFHGRPTINHVGRWGEGEEMVPGMTFTVEPMINMGDWRCVLLGDHWTVVTADHSLSAQFEHTVTVTDDGVEVLTLAEGATLDLTPPRALR
jgi:methionyl aminopeptidase